MLDGDITNASFTPAKFRDPMVLALMQKITVAEDPALTERVGPAVPTRVEAVLRDGRRVVAEVDHAPGFAARPMTRAQIEAKFHGNAGDRLPRSDIDDMLRELWSLENAEDLSALLGRFAARG